MRTRIDRVRGRLPEDADPPTIFKFDPNSAADHGPRRRRRLRPRHAAGDGREHRCRRGSSASPASPSVDGQRRAAPADSRRAVAEKIMALDLSVDRVVNILRTENQNIPIGEIYRGDTHLPAAQPGTVPEPRPDPQSRRPDEGRRAGLPEGHRRGEGLDRGHPIGAADQRHARRPDAGARSSRAPTPCRSPQLRPRRRSSGSTARCRASS